MGCFIFRNRAPPSGQFRQVFKNHRFSCSNYREVKRQKTMIMLKDILQYIHILILNSTNVLQNLLFCCHSRGRYSGKFTHGTSVLWEVGEVIEKISTYRFFLNLLKLFLGPYIFIKQFKNWGSTVLLSN